MSGQGSICDRHLQEEIAIALHTPPHRAVSLALLAQALGATKDAARQARRPSVARSSSTSASASSAGGAAASRDVELTVVKPEVEQAV